MRAEVVCGQATSPVEYLSNMLNDRAQFYHELGEMLSDALAALLQRDVTPRGKAISYRAVMASIAAYDELWTSVTSASPREIQLAVLEARLCFYGTLRLIAGYEAWPISGDLFELYGRTLH